MNFSNHLTDLLLYFFVSSPLFQPGLIVPDLCFESSTFQSFYSVNKLRLITPVLFGIAKVEIFLVLSSFLLNFISFISRGF